MEHPSPVPATLLGRDAPTGRDIDPDRAPDGRSTSMGPRRSGRDWVVDVTAFVLTLGIGLVGFGVELLKPVPLPAGVLAVDLVLGVAACLALWTRRRWPVGLAVVLAVAAAFSAVAGGAALFALFTVAVHRRWPTVAAVSAVNAVSVVCYELIRPDPDLPFVVVVAIVLLLTGGVVAWGMSSAPVASSCCRCATERCAPRQSRSSGENRRGRPSGPGWRGRCMTFWDTASRC